MSEFELKPIPWGSDATEAPSEIACAISKQIEFLHNRTGIEDQLEFTAWCNKRAALLTKIRTSPEFWNLVHELVDKMFPEPKATEEVESNDAA